MPYESLKRPMRQSRDFVTISFYLKPVNNYKMKAMHFLIRSFLLIATETHVAIKLNRKDNQKAVIFTGFK